jgi:sugar phosphate isomerase/epimerase
MRLACSSYSFDDALDDGMDLAEFFEVCASDLGVDGVELIDEHLPGDNPASLNRVADLAADHDLEVACLSVFYNDFAKATRAERREDVRLVTDWLDGADRLGADVVRAFTGFPGLHDRDHGDPDVWRDVTTCLQECVDYARTAEATLAVENHNHDGLVRTADDVFRVRSGVNGDLGLVLDLSNYVDGVDSVRRSLHLADHVHAAYDDVASDGSEPSQGFYPDVLASLDERGYDGYVTLEYEGDEDPFDVVPRAVEFLQRCVGH